MSPVFFNCILYIFRKCGTTFIINKPEIKKSVKIATKLIKGQGRILVRKSGTESKIRIMGESENRTLLSKCINIIVKKIR